MKAVSCLYWVQNVQPFIEQVASQESNGEQDVLYLGMSLKCSTMNVANNLQPLQAFDTTAYASGYQELLSIFFDEMIAAFRLSILTLKSQWQSTSAYALIDVPCQEASAYVVFAGLVLCLSTFVLEVFQWVWPATMTPCIAVEWFFDD